MKDHFAYKSTSDGRAPSGYQKKGTFKDVSLRGLEPEEIDEIDSECIERDITRREWANELIGGGPNGDPEKFYKLFSRTNQYQAVVENIGRRLNLDEPDVL